MTNFKWNRICEFVKRKFGAREESEKLKIFSV